MGTEGGGWKLEVRSWRLEGGGRKKEAPERFFLEISKSSILVMV